MIHAHLSSVRNYSFFACNHGLAYFINRFVDSREFWKSRVDFWYCKRRTTSAVTLYFHSWSDWKRTVRLFHLGQPRHGTGSRTFSTSRTVVATDTVKCSYVFADFFQMACVTTKSPRPVTQRRAVKIHHFHQRISRICAKDIDLQPKLTFFHMLAKIYL